MALVVPDLGELELLTKLLINTTDTEDYIVRLYQNNYSPSNTTVVGDFTEANFTSYTAKTLARSDWASPSTVGTKAESTGVVQSWTCGATGNTVYGYYVVGSTSGVCLWAEQFVAARILVDGDVLFLTPKFTLSSAN